MEKELSSDSNELSQNNSSGVGLVTVVYVLYLVGILVGLTSIVGVIMAYINKSGAPEWLRTHYQFQIRTFWIGLLYLIVGTVLVMVLVGYFILLFWLVWLIVRCVKGLQLSNKNQPIPNPKTWLF